ncbi:MAG: hypothetical protein JWR18_3548 [Segetibacter sp.]|nr:hypothetical protein [Segetibacter sp.]
MAKEKKQTAEELVSQYLHQLEYPLENVVAALRKIVLQTDKEISEHVKWNSLAFYYNGQMKTFDPKEYKKDIVVFNLHRKDSVLLVFPTGASIDDPTGLLEGEFTDSRKTVRFSSLKEVSDKEGDLQTVIKIWLKQVDK